MSTSLRRIFNVAARDLAHDTRRVLFWFWIALLVFFAWAFSQGTVRISSGNSAVGGAKAFVTSEFAVTQQLALLTTLLYGFFVAVVAGMTVIQDEEFRLSELLHATPLRPGEYIWGKFAAVVVGALLVLGIHLITMMLFNHAKHASAETAEYLGPFHLMNYVRPALIFNVPTVIFMAGLSFAMGEWSRKPVAVFFLPVAIFLGCGFFLWDWSPAWLDPRIDRALMFLDPAAFRWLNEVHLKVDRGVAFYNTERVPLDRLIVANRFTTLAIGLLAVAWTQWHFTRTLRGTSRRAERAWKAKGEQGALGSNGRHSAEPELGLSAGAEVDKFEAAAAPKTLASLGMSTAPPGLLVGAWTVAKAELAELKASPGLYLFVPLLVLEATGPILIAVGAFDTPLLITPGTFAARSMSALSIMACLLLLFYTVESFAREPNTRLASISLATPVKTGSILIGKAVANAVVGLVVLIAEWIAAAGMLLYQGKVSMDLKPFLLVWGLLLIPTLVLWTAFVMAVSSISRNRYATYAVCLAVLAYTGYRQLSGNMNWVGNWPLYGVLNWSDISVLEFDRKALWLNRIEVLGLAAFFIALTTKFYPRRELDPVGLAQRLRPRPFLWATLKLMPFAIVPVVVGFMLWVAVDRGFQGPSTDKYEKDYWRKNMATYTDWPLPDLTAVDVHVDLEPARRRLKSAGTLTLANKLGGASRSAKSR